MDLVAEPEFAMAFLERLTDTIVTAQTCYLKEVGDLIDIHFTADDFTGQKRPLHLAGDLPADDQTALGADHPSHQAPHQGANILPRLRRDRAIPARPDRDRHRHHQSGASVGGRHGHGATEKKVRQEHVLLGWRLRYSESAALRHAGRSASRDAKNASTTWRRTAALFSIQFTTSNRLFPLRILWRCSRRPKNGAIEIVFQNQKYDQQPI